MKKAKIFFFIGTIALLASCNTKYEAKTVQLNDQTDSLNYTLGLSNGVNIKNFYMRNDTTGAAFNEFMNTLVDTYNSKSMSDNSEMYELGKNIGAFFKRQEENGLIGDSTLAYNKKLALQGLINGLNNYNAGMTDFNTQDYFQKTIQEMRRPKPAAPAQEEAAQETVTE